MILHISYTDGSRKSRTLRMLITGRFCGRQLGELPQEVSIPSKFPLAFATTKSVEDDITVEAAAEHVINENE
jgi:hypothetical protein